MKSVAQTNAPNLLSVGQCATLACLWEATAAKPGNVHRGADFEDLTYVDFLTSATVIGPIIEQTVQRGIGRTIRGAVEATQAAVGTNTNLGILLLLAPLAAQGSGDGQIGIGEVMASLTTDDTRCVYEAIRLANPGGLGHVDAADVNKAQPPEITLLEAMQLAADRDLIARQYTNGFADVHWLADNMARFLKLDLPLNDAIVRAFVELLCREPDSLIVRKCGLDVATEVTARANAVHEHAQSDDAAYHQSLADFDFYLRSDGHRLNPGTSADMVAAALFILSRDGRIGLPVRFYSDNS